ncbi:hypothetical protein PISMIDRAFT_688292, partial [Pisolithus microcarpus 441]
MEATHVIPFPPTSRPYLSAETHPPARPCGQTHDMDLPFLHDHTAKVILGTQLPRPTSTVHQQDRSPRRLLLSHYP